MYIFGSRADDTKRGGDIDLAIRSAGSAKGVQAKVKMAARLKWLLGERKIDIIGDHEEGSVAHEVVNTGVLLSLGENMAMKNNRQQLKERIERTLSVCDRHFMRMEEAVRALGLPLPMTQSQYDSLDENQVRCIDQFLFRFTKAQEGIGGKAL